MQGAQNLKTVQFSVNAANNVHILLSATDPLTSNSWEIVFGGWAGTKSVLRSTMQGQNLVTVDHTVAQFQQVINLHSIFTLYNA